MQICCYTRGIKPAQNVPQMFHEWRIKSFLLCCALTYLYCTYHIHDSGYSHLNCLIAFYSLPIIDLLLRLVLLLVRIVTDGNSSAKMNVYKSLSRRLCKTKTNVSDK